MTAPTSEDLLALYGRGTLAAEMARRFGLMDREEVSLTQAMCAELHNSGALDLLKLAEDGSLQALEGSSFFMATHFFCKVLPDLQAPSQRVMACVEALVTRGGADGAANRPNAALREWCARDVTRTREILAAARAGDALAGRHLTFALEAMNDIPEARRILGENDERLRLSAITALGRMRDQDPASRAETIQAFGQLLDRGADDGLKASLLHATTFVMTQDGGASPSEALDLVRRLVNEPGTFVVHQAAHVLWAYPEAHQPELIQLLLSALLLVNPANKGTVNELDHGLETLMQSSHDEAAISFVTTLFGDAGELELTELDSFIAALVDGPADRLGRTVVSWLRNGSMRLCEGLAQVLRRQREEEPILELQDFVKDLPPPEQLFICRKAIGFFFLRPRTAASVLVSTLRVCDEHTAEEVQKYLVQPLLLNYGGVREYLSQIGDGDAAKARGDAALAANTAYLDGLRSVPDLKEFHPSELHRRIEHLRMADQMQAASKRARSQSILLSFVKRSVLLYGTRSLSFIRDDGNRLRPMEMDLKSFGVSFELPRMEIVDPVGLDYALRVYRAERMAS